MKRLLTFLAALTLLITCTPENNNSSTGNTGDNTIHVTGISLDRHSAIIKEGESVTLTATIAPDNATNKAVTWSTSDKSVATVDDNGNVIGIKAGNATITATTQDGGKKSTCALTVEANLAPSVTVGAEHVSAVSAVLKGKANLGSTVAADFKIGFQYSKSAGILPANSTTVDATDADANYNFTTGISGLEPSTTYYFRSFVLQNGQYTYGEIKAFATKELSTLVETLNATDIKATSATLVGMIDYESLAHAYTSISYGFCWGVSESTLNDMLNGGEIKDSAYSASLTGLSHNTRYWYKAYVTIAGQAFYGEVKPFNTDLVHVQSVSINLTEFTFRTIGNTLTLSATVLPTDATNKLIDWSSSNILVAVVDDNGTVTAVDNGTATITASATDGSGVTAACKVEVKQLVTSISLYNLALTEGQSQTLTATINPTNAYDRSLTWTSSDGSVAIVDQTGKVTAKSKGRAIINATANDGSGESASCSVIVSSYCPPGAVDLGMTTPDGYILYWATYNLCEEGFVSSPEEYGDYYAWGEIEPHYVKGHSQDNDCINWRTINNKTMTGYDWASYKWCNGTNTTLTKYNWARSYGTVDNKEVLELEDDAAHIVLGGNWRMPTDAEWTELCTKCSLEWTTLNGVNGCKVTGPNGNSIFLPATGNRNDTTLRNTGNRGDYWSSSLKRPGPDVACYTRFGSFFSSTNSCYNNSCYDRFNGKTIRPVME